MINLIPNQEKKKKVKDFYFRLAVVSIAVLGVCVLAATVALLPAYFLSSVDKNLASEKLQIQKNEPVPVIDQNSLATIKDINKKISLIEGAENGKYLVSQRVVNEIILRKMPDIKIEQITYENNPVTGKSIKVSGTAPNRERLLLFSKALEGDAAFQKVDLPISNFVKASNIEFSLTITPA